jgi:hypothetical protein
MADRSNWQRHQHKGQVGRALKQAGRMIVQWTNPRRTFAEFHVLPINDLKPHVETGSECWCEPKVDKQEHQGWKRKALLITHNSMDGRELIERYGIQ